MRILRVITLIAALAACSQEGVLGSLQSSVPISTNAIAAGGDGTCVRTASGEARCWGSNENGGLGVGTSTPATSAVPLFPVNLDGVTALFGGELARCALRINGELACWGRVGIASYATGRFIDDRLVVLNPFAYISAIGDISVIAVGRFFLCSLNTTGEVRCFGKNDKGQLGLGSTDDEINPTTLHGLDGPATSLAASMGGDFACATTRPGSVACWGDAPAGVVGEQAAVVTAPQVIQALPERPVQVAVGGAHACARLLSGKVACWGEGKDGQLGSGDLVNTSTPVLADITDVVALSAGGARTCAVRSEGSVFCWGTDVLGAKAPGVTAVPAIVVESSFKARAVTSGLGHSCAWGDGGRVACWGDNSVSQLGPERATF
jgi:alpha-tubulin suppressor-like RCC1 family protein